MADEPKVTPKVFVNLTGSPHQPKPPIKQDSEYIHNHRPQPGTDGTYSNYVPGLEAALDLLESRQRIFDGLYHSEAAIAGLDDLKVFLEGALSRAKRGEYPYMRSEVAK